MNLATKRLCWRFLLFGLWGLLFEVFFTAAGKLIDGNWNMHGQSSPWMMLDYGLAGVLYQPVNRLLKRIYGALWFRAIGFMLMIFIVEFISGWLFDLVGLRIWSYKSLPYNLCGYIALMYVPIWYGLGLTLDFFYRWLDAFAFILANRWDAVKLEKNMAEIPPS